MRRNTQKMTTQTKTTENQKTLPTGWRKVKLGEVLEKVIDNRGKTPPLAKSGYPMIEVFQLSRDRKYPDLSDAKKQKFVSEITYKTWFRSGHPKEGDILMSTVGTIAQWNLMPKDEEYCIAQNVVALRPDLSKTTPEFLRFYFNQRKFVSQVEGIVIGATQSSVRLPHFLNLDIEIPSLDTQKRIADILSAFDDKIELNNKISQTLEQMAQAIFKEWFVNFRFPGYEKVKFIDSELGKIPEGWEVKNIGSIANVVLGGTPSRLKPEYWGGEIPWINSGKVNEFRIVSASEYITEAGLKNSNARLMPKRTTLIAITGATLGQVSLLEVEASANQSVIGIFDSDNLPSEFIYLYIKQNIDDLISAAAGGAQQHINKQIVESYEILVPSDDIISKFAKILRPIFDQIANIVFESQKLAALRDLLLPKLMSGEIRV